MASSVVGIKDVALAAGVSVGTVSNVLNKPDAVSPERRERVRRVIKQLGYVPNDAARQLKAGVSRAIGLVVLDASNPFYGSMALHAEDEAEGRNLGLFVASSHGRHSKEEFYLSLFEQQRARGILVTPDSADFSLHRAVMSRGTRVILVDAAVPEEDFCSVMADDHHGGYEAVRHLIAQGRRRIAVIGGPGQFRQVAKRREGALAAVAEAGGVEMDYVEPEDMSILAGRHAGEQIAQQAADQRPDGIFAMNDLLATGILQALVMQRDLSVPGDVALIGYDDIDFCSNAVVPISSVRQPTGQMGRVAVELLEAELADGDEHEHRTVMLKPQLVPRASTLG